MCETLVEPDRQLCLLTMMISHSAWRSLGMLSFIGKLVPDSQWLQQPKEFTYLILEAGNSSSWFPSLFLIACCFIVKRWLPLLQALCLFSNAKKEAAKDGNNYLHFILTYHQKCKTSFRITPAIEVYL